MPFNFGPESISSSCTGNAYIRMQKIVQIIMNIPEIQIEFFLSKTPNPILFEILFSHGKH